MVKIQHKIAVLSGKGGVGKSMVAANLAVVLSQEGFATGIVDVDLSGPSIPQILGVRDQRLMSESEGIIPAVCPLGIKVISMGFMLEDKEAVTWFHDLRRGAIEEFLAHVNYGALDFLIIDLPPGTGTETIAVMQYIPNTMYQVFSNRKMSLKLLLERWGMGG